MLTRRQFAGAGLAAVSASAAPPKISSTIHGVRMGVAGWSYTTLPREGILDVILESMKDAGLADCLLYGPLTEPADLANKARPARGRGRAAPSPERAAAVEALRQWHLTVPLSYYAAIRKKFADAGISFHSYDAALAANASDEDIEKALNVAKTLGADCMMCAVPRSTAKRIAPMAEKHKMKVAFQGRPNLHSTDPDIMAKPADFEEAMGYSKNFGTCIDVGDATGAGWDALQFIRDTHPRVFALNLKDRTKANISMPWGQGDARIAGILQLIRDNKYPVRCYIDCDYATQPDTTRTADIGRCFEFAKTALNG